MKTKEIEVTVPWDFGDKESFYVHKLNTPKEWENIKDLSLFKAKLIIELPGKKIEITERQFDEAVKNIGFDKVEGLMEDLKQKLFGKDAGRTV